MLLSIVVPAWNEERYIQQCLNSLTSEAAHSGLDVEIIVVNNASEDRTREMASAFTNVLIVDEPVKGLPQARQSGFLASRGDIIANIDADCLMPSGWISKVCKEFSCDDALVALSGPYQYYDLSLPNRLWVTAYYYLAYIIHCVGHHVLKRGAVLQGGNFVLRRSALEKIGGFNTNLQFYGEDTEIAQRIQKIGKVKFMLSLKMLTSGRRLIREGVMTMAIKYAINYIWIVLFNRPYTKEYICMGNLNGGSSAEASGRLLEDGDGFRPPSDPARTGKLERVGRSLFIRQ